MSVSIILAIAAIVVGIGGALATLVAWGQARRSLPREAETDVAQKHLSHDQRRLILVWSALAIIVVVIIIVSVIPTKRPTSPHSTSSSVAPIAVLSDPASSGVEDVAFSPNGTVFATADLNGSIRLWNLITRRVIATLLDPDSQGVSAVAFSSQGTTLAAGDRNGGTYLWKLSGGPPIVSQKIFDCQGSGGINALAFRVNGELAVGKGGTVCAWASTTGKVVFTVDLTTVSALAFSPDGALLAAGTADGTVQLLDPATGHLIASLPAIGTVSSVAFSSNSKLLAVGNLTGQTRVWDMAAAQHPVLVGTLANPASQGVSSVAFSADSITLATADVKGKTYLWNPALHKIIAVLVDPGSQGVSAVEFSLNGRLIATADLNGSTYLWKYPTKLILRAAREAHG